MKNHENHKNILKIARTSNPAKGSYNEDRSSSTLDVNLAQNIVCRRPVPDISFLSCFHFVMILYDFAQNREHRENRENHENHENHEIIICDFYDFQNMSRTGPRHEKVPTQKVPRTGPLRVVG